MSRRRSRSGVRGRPAPLSLLEVSGQRLQKRLDRFWIDRLGQMMAEGCSDRLVVMLRFAPAGDGHQNGRVSPGSRANSLRECISIDIGKTDIRKNNVGTKRLSRIKGIASR